jgi:hypothetical protein
MAAPVTPSRTIDGEIQLSRCISLARRVEQKPSLLNLSDEACLADRLLVFMVNVASDNVDGNRLGGRWDEEVYPTDPEARSLMKLSTSGRGSVITKEILLLFGMCWVCLDPVGVYYYSGMGSSYRG